MSHHHDVCDTCLKVWCRCNATPVQPQPTSGALTREQVERDDFTQEQVIDLIATIEQQGGKK